VKSARNRRRHMVGMKPMQDRRFYRRDEANAKPDWIGKISHPAFASSGGPAGRSMRLDEMDFLSCKVVMYASPLQIFQKMKKLF
jgi:hypothetical protein